MSAVNGNDLVNQLNSLRTEQQPVVDEEDDNRTLSERLDEQAVALRRFPTRANAQKLLQLLQSNDDCRGIITAAVSGSHFSNAFVVTSDYSHLDLLVAFLDKGMNVDIQNRDGNTVLMSSCFHNRLDVVRLLLDRNANVNIQNNEAYTALMWAAFRGYVDIARLLLQRNANTDLQNLKGVTALISASMSNRPEVVRLLLDHNADVDIKNTFGKTAMDLAATEEIKEMLRNHVDTSYVLK